MLEVLMRHHVECVVIGGFAGVLWGSPLPTGDIDVCPSQDRANLQRLADALTELEARVRAPDAPEGLRFAIDAAGPARGSIWNLITKFGWLDLTFEPAGTRGFDDLRRDASIIDIGDSVEVLTASLLDVIRSKEAAGTAKDRVGVIALRELLERISQAGEGSG